MSFALAIIAAIILAIEPLPDGIGAGPTPSDGTDGVDVRGPCDPTDGGDDGADDVSAPVLTLTPEFPLGSPARTPPLPCTGTPARERPLWVSTAAAAFACEAPDFTRVMSEA